jgi:DNA-binding transcriptional MerR regulator
VYTVKQLSDLAEVSVRTLHYYDEIALLKPTRVGENGYRYYADDAVYRLQQILFFRELDLSLEEIRTIMEQPGFDLVAALQAHRAGIEAKIRRLEKLITTIDGTIMHLTGEVDMSRKKLFAGFTEEEEKRYAEEARQTWGREAVDASYRKWNSYTAKQKEQIGIEGMAIYTDLAALIDEQKAPASPEVQAVIARWHQHMRYFYEPTMEGLRGLGDRYVSHPDFARNFREVHPNLPEFMQEAIRHYCDHLETTAQ